MSHFKFKAKKAGGEIYSGERDAADRYELFKLMRDSGEEVISYEEKASSKGLKMEINIKILKHVGMMEKINFARNLGSMLGAGLTLSRAMSVLERQTKNKTFKDVITDLISNISKGSTFADSLSKHKKVFPPLFISMVHAGEQSGTLGDSLKAVASQMDSSYTLERRIRGALMYPGVIISAMVIIAILMFVFVIPTLLKTFTELHVKLPLTTRVVLGVSTVIQHYGLLVLLAIALMIAGVIAWSRKPEGKKIVHALLLRIPVIGSLVQEVNTARTARTFSSLLGAGVGIVESISITADVVQNVHFKKVLNEAREGIKKGDLMSKTFASYEKYYPVFFAEMISVGEETGKIGEMLSGVARYYEDDVEQRTKDMSTIIEPFLIVVIGAAVGFFAVSMIQPMYSLVNVI